MSCSSIARAAAATLAILAVAPALCHAQITPGQIDNFTTNGTQNWSHGLMAPAGSLIVTTGGPGGSTDNYMQVTATGFGAGGRITVFNRDQWLGNYITAGVTTIDMDLRAPTTNTQNLLIRIAFKQDTSQFGPGYVTTTPFTLANDGQWHHASFTVSAAQMTAVGPANPFETLLANPAELRILHSTNTFSLNGDPIVAVLGVDNIQAGPVPVPEPTSVLAGAGAATAVGWWLRRLRQHANRA